MEPTGYRDYVGDTRVALAIVGCRIVVAEVSEVADDSLVEVGKLLVGESVSVEASRIGTALEKGLDLMALEAMVVVRAVEATRRGRWDSRYVCKWICRRRTVFNGGIGVRDTFIGGIDGGWVAIDSDWPRTVAGSREVSPSGCARRNGPINVNSIGSQSLSRGNNR